ncbi:MAG: thiamine phosphate synthase [Thermodesulfovibrio sp.]|jgi:thiamine-phosphate pyrophosphorylase|uniref:Thiamine-phosphate synthase n=1 Tax=Thermodesulfovibrio obliviosus TaxID=3118332 RepID=A0AAU8H5G0_9BACT
MLKLKGLYVITDEKLTPYEKILEMVEEALNGGACVVQLRDKTNSDNFLLPYGFLLKELCEKYNAYFIVNDRVDLAMKLDAHGVHIGKEDADISEVKEKLKNKIIGVSCYGDIKKAKNMESLGACYVAFGSFYYSPTKPQAEIVDKSIIIEAKKILSIPVCVIGGLNVERAKELVNLGADIVAVVSDIWTAPSIRERAKEYKNLFT